MFDMSTLCARQARTLWCAIIERVLPGMRRSLGACTGCGVACVAVLDDEM